MKTLLKKIRAIDPAAAEYIENTVLPRYAATGKEPQADLSNLFLWEDSPQKSQYWQAIYLKLLESDRLVEKGDYD